MLVTATASEPGGRINEDAFLVHAIPNGLLLAVADGVGGRSGGRVAAEFSLELLKEKFQRGPAEPDLRQVVYDIDRRVLQDDRAGETALVVCVVVHNQLRGVSVGDSGAWLFAPDGIDLTARQERRPFLGSGCCLPAPFGALSFEGTLLLATDGLLKCASHTAIEEIVARVDLARIPQQLLDSARMPSGGLQDDTTAVVARMQIASEHQEHPAHP